MKKESLVIGIVLIIVLLLGTTYAWFNYRAEGSDNKLIAGDIYLNFDVNGNGISLTSIFPETKEEARSRDDNFMTFTIRGANTTGKTIYYEILLNEGDDVQDKTRFKADELVFDLIEVGKNNSEKLLLDAVSFNDLNLHKIYVDRVASETNEPIERTYKLRMWLSDKVTIGNGANVTYDQDDYKNHYANIKIAVAGDLEKKSFPLTYDLEETLNNFSINLSNDYAEEEYGNSSNDTLELKVSSTDSNVRFNIAYTELDGENENETNKTNQTSIDETFNYTIFETKNIELETKNIRYNGSDIYFEVIKNGNVVQKFIKTVYRTNNDRNIMKESLLDIPNIQTIATKVEFVNVSKSELDINYAIDNINVFDLTLDDGERHGDVRGKINNGTLTIASEGKTYLSSGFRLFSGWSNIESIDFTNIDTSLVTLMNYMFYNCTSLQHIYKLNNFNTSRVRRMNRMFRNCEKLVELDLSSFITKNVINMEQMFHSCKALHILDLQSFTADSLLYMSAMFHSCELLENIIFDNFNTHYAIGMSEIFYGCASLINLDLSSFDTSNATQMYRMFYGCTNITTIDLEKFTTKNVQSTLAMFYNCSSLTTINVSNSWTSENIVDTSNMFHGCKNLTGGNGTKYSSSNKTILYARIDNPPEAPGYFTYKEPTL